MFKSIRYKTERKAPQILIAIGILVLLLAGVMKVYLLTEDYLAGYRANLVLEQMRIPVSNTTQPTVIEPIYYGSVAEDIPDTDTPKHSPVTAVSQEQISVPTTLLDADSGQGLTPVPTPTDQPKRVYDTVGVLNIPQLRLELPVLSEYTNDLLQISVCKYKGDAKEKPQRLVIAGHNYNRHFGKLPKLSIGDDIFFTNLGGTEYRYTVSEITEISMYDHEALEDSDWEITLFTCNSADRSRRILIRCKET